MREIKFFKTSSNRYPVEEFLDSLAAKQAQMVFAKKAKKLPSMK
jgi:hypothetical protein